MTTLDFPRPHSVRRIMEQDAARVTQPALDLDALMKVYRAPAGVGFSLEDVRMLCGAKPLIPGADKLARQREADGAQLAHALEETD